MKIYAVTGTVPIIKEYYLDDAGVLQKKSYPHLYSFTSQELDVCDIQTFENVVNTTAANNGALVKGVLNRQLQGESRAGSTDPNTPTEWICLDLDDVQGVQSVDHFLQEIGLGDVDYVLQWSSSMGIENSSGFRCHIFMLLDKPTSPLLLKSWLQNLNLTCPTLINSLKLTKTYNALSWPLDTTTCQNDKLIYVAPPAIGAGIVTPLNGLSRISCVQKTVRHAVIPTNVPSQTSIRTKIDAKVNELRAVAGFEKRKTSKYSYSGDIEFLQNPDAAVATEVKVERGFVYLNLNGGDSWGYYHPEDNPAFIYNFKGEPTYRTQDLLPAYWAQIVQRVKTYQPDTAGKIYLVFRDLHTATYWNGTFDTKTQSLDIYKANGKEQLKDFMKQHGQPTGDYVPDWILDFDPGSSVRVDPVRRRINTYEASPYFAAATVGSQTVPPPTIDKLVRHFTGGDAATVEHFYNWLAVIAQKLDRTGTSWVLQSIQGTGKGLFFHRVLTPIFGARNVVSKRVEEIESNFTGYFRNKFIVYIDEMEVGKGDYFSKVTAKLKNIIVEPTISIRPMYQEAEEVKNYANLIFSTNKMQGAQVDMDDRRYNVGAYQRTPVTAVLSNYEIDTLLSTELQAFTNYLLTRPADVATARRPLDNAARRLLQKIGQAAVDEISMNLKSGNLQYFAEWISSPDEAGMKKYAAQKYRDIIVNIAANPTNTTVTRQELQDILGWLLDNVPQTPVKFAAFIKHHDIELVPVWTGTKTVRGIKVNWSADPAWLTQFNADVAAGNI